MKRDKSSPRKKDNFGGSNGRSGGGKFELMSCQQNGQNCEDHLLFINENYSESNIYHQNKEYQKSIEALNKAFGKTYDLREKSCSKCAKMFRSTIIQSLENIHLELHNISTGLFKTKRYKTSYIMAENVLQNLKEEVNRK